MFWGLQVTYLLCSAASSMVHKYFSSWYIYDSYPNRSYFYKADYCNKIKAILEFKFVRLKTELKFQMPLHGYSQATAFLYPRFILLSGESLYAGDFFMMFFKAVRSCSDSFSYRI